MWEDLHLRLKPVIVEGMPKTPEGLFLFLFVVVAITAIAGLVLTRYRRKRWFSLDEFMSLLREGLNLGTSIVLFAGALFYEVLRVLTQLGPFLLLAGGVLLWSAFNKINAITKR
jgi:hypothetical protein